MTILNHNATIILSVHIKKIIRIRLFHLLQMFKLIHLILKWR